MPRALVLFAGTLESALAVKLLARDPQWEIDLLYIRSPFSPPSETIREVAQKLFPGLPFRSLGLKRDYLAWSRLITDSLLFPCGVCRFTLLWRAGKLLRKRGYDFIVTGELVGKGGIGAREIRAMEGRLGLVGKVLRPLCGALLHDPDVEGYRPLDLRAADTKALLKLAQEMGIDPHWLPQSDCPLLDDGYARRVEHFLRQGKVTINSLQLLHFPDVYAGEGFQLVVAHSPQERQQLTSFFLPGDIRLYLPIPGSPLGLLRLRDPRDGELEAYLELCGGILAAVADWPQGRRAPLHYRRECDEHTERIWVRPLPPPYLERLRLPPLHTTPTLVQLI